MVYLVYKTTNKTNGKYYIGCHATNNINDGYIGSGKLLRRAIAKYGIENFEREVIAVFDTAEEMFQMESVLVNEHLVENKNTYNLALGGSGGSRVYGNHPTHSPEHMAMMREKSLERLNDPIEYAKVCQQMSKNVKRSHEAGNRTHTYFGECEWHQKAIDRANTPESKQKRKETYNRIKFQQGKNNSQFGTCWITNGTENKKIKKGDDIPSGWRAGRSLK